jgi:hypothetical protein
MQASQDAGAAGAARMHKIVKWLAVAASCRARSSATDEIDTTRLLAFVRSDICTTWQSNLVFARGMGFLDGYVT